jgi:FSR family fosmidomycin resistance protein-like MFS transporter
MKLPRPIAGLVFGHFSIDFWQGTFPALLPLLHTERRYSLAANGALLLAFNLSSSVVQPLFGLASDRQPRPWMMPAGILLTGVCLSLFGVVNDTSVLLGLAALGGMGVAAFHPEAVRLVRTVAAAGARSTAISWFNVGGSLGFATGPLVAGMLFTHFGLGGTPWLLLPLVGMVAFTWRIAQGHAEREARSEGAAKNAAAGRDRWDGFALVSVGVVCRSIVFFGLSTMVPLLWLRGAGHGAGGASLLLSALFAAGVVGQLTGGWLGDRWGRNRTVMVGFAIQIPVMLALAHATGAFALIALSAAAGAAMSMPFSSLVVMGQDFLPNRVGLASGVTVGLAITAGGLLAPWMGALADAHGAAAVINGLAWVPLAAVAAALGLARLRPPAPAFAG